MLDPVTFAVKPERIDSHLNAAYNLELGSNLNNFANNQKLGWRTVKMERGHCDCFWMAACQCPF